MTKKRGCFPGPVLSPKKHNAHLLYIYIYKIRNFTKSTSSVGGIPKFGFLVHMAVIKDNKSSGDGLGAEIAKSHQ